MATFQFLTEMGHTAFNSLPTSTSSTADFTATISAIASTSVIRSEGLQIIRMRAKI